MSARELDLVLWGATGFVGRLAAQRLFSRSRGSDLRWGLGGRDLSRLESLRSELGPGAAGIPVLEGDSFDPVSLEALARRTRVVCSTVGPYAKYGSGLVEACVRHGTHYCDIAGEIPWIREMMDTHQAEAERTGARIVPACGMDSIPSDLGVFTLQAAARRRFGRPCSSVRMRLTAMKGGFSGGTAASLIHGLEEDSRDRAVSRCIEDPYSLNPAGQREGPDPPDCLMSCEVSFDRDLKAWTKPFFMAPVNAKIVRRTNAVLGYPYGRDFRYEEAQLVGPGPLGWLKAATEAAGLVGVLVGARMPPARWVLQNTLLPAPGEGPGQDERVNGFWEIVLVGEMDGDSVIQAEMRGKGDPATGSTSRMLVEAALCLARDTDRITVGGGFWTPASAMGACLLPRLTARAGLSFDLYELVPERAQGEGASS